MGRLYALFILGWALLRSLLGRVIGPKRGLAAFQRSYREDRVLPMAPLERENHSRLTGCIACGLCDAGEGASMVRSQGMYAGIMDLMLASSRSMPDYDAAVRSFDAVGDARLAEKEKRCPVRVPMRQVAAFVRAKAAKLA